MAEVKRLQLIKDLDEQVRIKKEQERIRALEEAIQEAKIERRIQETIEEERRVLALKEAQMAAMNGGEYDEHGDVGFPGDAAVTTVTTAGGGRVMNSPPAPPRPLTGTEPEPGMPNRSVGTSPPPSFALLELSGPMTPRTSPEPKFDLSLVVCTECP